jgi:hypothetical protein
MRIFAPETTQTFDNHFPKGPYRWTASGTNRTASVPYRSWKVGEGPPVPFPHSPYALQHATEEQKGDRALMLAACKKFGAALQYASPKLRADAELVLVASEKTPLPLQWADPRLWLDSDFMTACVKRHGYGILKYYRKTRMMMRAELNCVHESGLSSDLLNLDLISKTITADRVRQYSTDVRLMNSPSIGPSLDSSMISSHAQSFFD